jgi:hypothetical protein
MRLARLSTLAISGVLAALLAGCAGNDAPPAPGHGPGARNLPNLFISPAGKPYRAPRDAAYPSAQWFAAADADHDGRLTREELRADAAAFFRDLDVNHDGVVDGFEVQRYEREVAPEINPQIEGLHFGEGMDLSLGEPGDHEGRPRIGKGARLSDKSEAGDRRPEGAGLFGLLDEPEPVAATDAKFDSRITLEEFLAAADRRFTALDRKGLGYLMLQTLPKTPVQVALERQAAQRAKDAARGGTAPGERP